MQFKAAIFDMDGTLIDSLMLWDVLWDIFSKEYCDGKVFRPEADVEKAVRTLTLKEAMYLVNERYHLAESGDELFNKATQLIRNFYANEVKLKKGVREFLDFLLENGTKMCIASATDKELIKIAMEHCDLNKYFPKVFSCSDIGKGKEEPDVFIAAAKYLGEDISNTWVFEDSYVALETAHRAGFKTIGIYDKYGFRQDVVGEMSIEYISEGRTLEELIY